MSDSSEYKNCSRVDFISKMESQFLKNNFLYRSSPIKNAANLLESNEHYLKLKLRYVSKLIGINFEELVTAKKGNQK